MTRNSRKTRKRRRGPAEVHQFSEHCPSPFAWDPAEALEMLQNDIAEGRVTTKKMLVLLLDDTPTNEEGRRYEVRSVCCHMHNPDVVTLLEYVKADTIADMLEDTTIEDDE